MDKFQNYKFNLILQNVYIKFCIEQFFILQYIHDGLSLTLTIFNNMFSRMSSPSMNLSVSTLQHTMKRILFIIVLCAVTTSCSRVSQSGSSIRIHQNVILRDEILRGQTMNVYNLIRTFRPQWMGSGRLSRQNAPIFYIDGTKVLYYDSIYQMPSRNVFMIEYISQFDPTVIGVDSRYGAILITLFKQ